MKAGGAGRARPRPPAALYVHVPFCVSVCPYCDFVVYGGRAARGPERLLGTFTRAALTEIGLRAEAAAREGARTTPLRSVYIGGGTPSLLSPAQVADVLGAVDAGFRIARSAEITLEANPGPDERGDLRGFRSAGVNRLSIGAQSMRPAELRRLGRRHGPQDVVETVSAARAAGFDNVSLDLLYDVPGQTIGSWRETLDSALALEPDHVSAYALALDDPDAEGLTGALGDHLPLRPGARRWRQRAGVEQDADRAADCYELADERLSSAGFAWYEISNWARPGRQSEHNLVYWRRQPYEAIGPGAYAFDGTSTRRWNAARLDRYLAALAPLSGFGAPSLPPGGAETLDEGTILAERAILGLRLREGVTAEVLEVDEHRPALRLGLEQGLLEPALGGRLQLTLRGRLLSNELFAGLLPADAAPLAA